MKRNVRDQLILVFGALITLIAGVYTIVSTLDGWAGYQLWQGVILLVIGVTAVFFSVGLWLYAWRCRPKRQEFVVQKAEDGEVRIAIKALESLVEKCVKQHDELRLEQLVITNAREGVWVALRIAVAINVSIPLLTSTLQKQIKQHLSVASGVDIREVRVSVDVVKECVEDSPYLVADALPACREEACAPQTEETAAPDRMDQEEVCDAVEAAEETFCQPEQEAETAEAQPEQDTPCEQACQPEDTPEEEEHE